MALRRSRTAQALWPTLFGLAVVLAVVGANLWAMWQAEPEPATLDPLQRLDALHQSRQLAAQVANAGLPATAQANADDDAAGAASDGRAGADPGAARPIGSSATLSAGAAGHIVRSAVRGEATRSVVVQPAESLGGALARLYVTGTVQRDVIAAYAKLRKPERLQAGWRLWARYALPQAAAPLPGAPKAASPAAQPASGSQLLDGSALLAVVVAPGHGEGITVARDDHPAGDHAFSASEGGLPGTVVRRAVRCGVVGPLEIALRRCGEDEATAAYVAQILADRLHPALELKSGDELRLVVDKLYDGDQLVRTLGIAALEVRPPEAAATTVLHFDDGHGTEGFFSAHGEAAEAMFLRQPLRSGHTTSGFGMRLHPILHQMKAHYGVDFAAGTGTPVFAAADGVLISAHKAGAAGNLIRLRHGDGYVSEYMHLQKFASGLDSGDAVTKGQTIGYVGSTGRSTGPHLHFGVRKNGRYLDPTSLGDVLQPGIGAKARHGFEAQAAELLKLLRGLDKANRS